MYSTKEKNFAVETDSFAERELLPSVCLPDYAASSETSGSNRMPGKQNFPLEVC